MNDLNIPATSNSPTIESSWQDGRLTLRGDSYPENSFELFQPIIDWVETFLAQETRRLTLELELLYLNTSSIRVLMDILDSLEEAHSKGRDVLVIWRFDRANERVAQLGEEFKEDCTFPFDIVARD